MGFFDDIGNAISRAGRDIWNAPGVVAGGVQHLFADPGGFISDAQARAYGYPDAAAYNTAMAKDKGYQADVAEANKNPVSNYLSQNPAAAAAFNAAGGYGANVNADGVAHFGQNNNGVDSRGSSYDNSAMNAPNVADSTNNGTGPDASPYGINNALNTQGATNPSLPYPTNQGGTFSPAPSSPLSLGPSMGVQNSSSLGYSPINLTQPNTPAPISVGVNPVNNGPSVSSEPDTFVPGQNPVGTTINGVLQDHTSPTPGIVGATINGVTQDHVSPVDATNAASASNGGNFLRDNATALALGGGALVSAGGAVASSLIQAHGADAAAQKIVDANAAATKTQQGNLAAQTALEDPYITAGKKGIGDLSALIANHKDPSAADFQTSPDYAWRMSQGIKGLENSDAARGEFGGNTMKAIVDYGQNQGASEFKDYAARANTNYGNNLNALGLVSGMGQTAVGQLGQAGMNASNNISQNAIASGNALAGGITGAASAYASGLVGATNAVNNGASSYMNYQQQTPLMNALANQFRNQSKPVGT